MKNFFKYQGITRSGEIKEEQVKCPSCGSFKTIPYSHKTLVKTSGGFLIFIGLVLTFFTLVLGIPFLLIGAVVMFSSMAVKETGEWRCNSCGFVFFHKK